MSSNLVFPANLPDPLPDYTELEVESRTQFESETGYIRRRRRTSTPPRKFELSWVLSTEQLNTFQNWFDDILDNGSRDFDIQLLDDDKSLVWYTVTIPSGNYTSEASSVSDWLLKLSVQSLDEPFVDRISGSAQLDGFARLDSFGTGALKPAGVNLLGSGIGEGSGIGRLLIPFRGLGLLETFGTGFLIETPYTPELRETDNGDIRETNLGDERQTS